MNLKNIYIDTIDTCFEVPWKVVGLFLKNQIIKKPNPAMWSRNKINTWLGQYIFNMIMHESWFIWLSPHSKDDDLFIYLLSWWTLSLMLILCMCRHPFWWWFAPSWKNSWKKLSPSKLVIWRILVTSEDIIGKPELRTPCDLVPAGLVD